MVLDGSISITVEEELYFEKLFKYDIVLDTTEPIDHIISGALSGSEYAVGLLGEYPYIVVRTK